MVKMGTSVETYKRERLSAMISDDDHLDGAEVISGRGSGKPHVVMIPFPIEGHINPVMELARQLAAPGWGFRVTVVTTDHQAKRLMLLQAEDCARHHHHGGGAAMLLMMPVDCHLHHDNQDDDDVGIELLGVPDGLPEAHHRHTHSPDILLLLSNFQRGVEEQALPNLMASRPALAALISDSFLVWTQPLANRWHIPRFCFWTNSLAAFACSFHLPRVLTQLAAAAGPAGTCNPFKEEVYDPSLNPRSRQLTVDLPGIVQLPIYALPFKTLHGDLSAQWLYEQVQEQFRCLEAAQGVIVNSFEALEEPVWQHLKDEVPINVYLVGPLLPPPLLTPQNGCEDGGNGKLTNEFEDDDGGCMNNPSEEDEKEGFLALDGEDCMRWLDKQGKGSVLYISWGTSASLTLKEIYEVVDGLATCKQAFLWVLKGSKDARSEVTIGPHNLPGDLQAYLRKRVGSGLGKITGWAPQRRVLAHRAVGGFLSHCGWNSTLEGLSCGVPIIGCPSFLDQNTNCWWLVNHAHAGVELRNVEAQEVARVVNKVMRSPEGELLRSRALQIKSAAAKSSPRSSHLHRLVQRVLLSSTTTRER